MYRIPKLFTILSFTGLAIVYLVGLIMPDIMEVDAAQYASISMEMMKYGNYLEVHHQFGNYLDKPPLLFWLSALFMKIFGVNHIAYRLPTLLSTILGVYATFRLGKSLYDKNTGILSALLLAGSQAYILHNHDVRTDTLLTNFVIFAIWQLTEYLNSRKAKYFIGAFVGMGLAMLTKGPIGLMVPVLAIGSQLVFRRKWWDIFNWRWLLGLLIIAVMLTPMLIGLYNQYDANPMAMVNGRINVSGLRFYFWEQSFGRLTGENVWKNDTTYFFFTHSYLWEFIPWSILGIAALVKQFKKLIKVRFRPVKGIEVVTLGGFILPFLALSASQYKLPHYILVIMPLIAIMTAHYIDGLLRGNVSLLNWFAGFQFVQSILIWTVLLLIIYGVFPSSSVLWWILILVLFLTMVFMFFQGRLTRLVGVTLAVIIGANIVMNGYFYPKLNEFQAGRAIARYIVKNNIKSDDLILYRMHQHNMNFYSGEFFDWVFMNDIKERMHERKVLVYTDDIGLQELSKENVAYQLVEVFWNFPNTALSFEFLNPKTRTGSLTPTYLIMIPKQ